MGSGWLVPVMQKVLTILSLGNLRHKGGRT
jgi:hypothetical protein